MVFYLARVVSQPFEAAVANAMEQLQSRGFGVLSDIDVQVIFRAKLGADTPRYRILGACNPKFAHEALQAEERLGALLPCNVIVRELPDRRVEVASIDPVSSLERTGNPALHGAAQEVRRLLSEVIESVGP